ncbi:MAG: SDR family oxidoreductase [Thermoleophilia bacterium]|nr:SDR family oxidoreductase [Thermoleophilia bacterium]
MSDERRTAFVTGASSGIGLETAAYFFERGWNVVATMRDPGKRRTPLHDKGLPDLVHLDVTDGASVRAAVRYAVEKYGSIDVLVNNAGYALYGPFEATTREQIARQFDTNLFGLMEVTREVLPVFRGQGGGVVVNIASMGGRTGFPLYSVYNSSKWAVEGWTEALQYELDPLNIKVKLIEPGVIKTDFYGRSMEPVDCTAFDKEYGDILKRGRKSRDGGDDRPGTDAQAVAKVVYRAATDGGSRLRYTVGNDARLVLVLRHLLPGRLFHRLLGRVLLD